MKKLIVGTIFLATSLFAGSDSFHKYAKVKYSEPIYEYVYTKVPQRQCEEVRYKVKNRNYDDRYYSSNNDQLGIDTLIGTAAGAVIGSQIGKGNGRVAAQIVGGLIGAKVAHEIRDYNEYDRGYEDYTYETKTECYKKVKRVKEKVITGYKNYFVYNGVEHYKVTSRPKKRIKITHRIDF